MTSVELSLRATRMARHSRVNSSTTLSVRYFRPSWVRRTRRANSAKSEIRARIEHVFAEQKDRMDLFIRTIGLPRATIKIGLANLVYNFKRLIFLRRRALASG